LFQSFFNYFFSLILRVLFIIISSLSLNLLRSLLFWLILLFFYRWCFFLLLFEILMCGSILLILNFVCLVIVTFILVFIIIFNFLIPACHLNVNYIYLAFLFPLNIFFLHWYFFLKHKYFLVSNIHLDNTLFLPFLIN